MLAKLTIQEEIQTLADEDLAKACEKAREHVARDPRDERAALLLSDVVGRFASVAATRPSRAHRESTVPDAMRLIAQGDLEAAEVQLRQHLKAHKNDPYAMHLMAEIAARCGFMEDAERILRQAALLHASSAEARTDLGKTLHRIACARDYPEYIADSLAALDDAARLEPDCEDALAYKAAILLQIRQLDEAEAVHGRLATSYPERAEHWSNYAYLLKTVGHFGRAVAAYRTAFALDPKNGGAWWGLSNLKLARFFDADVAKMEEVLRSGDIGDDNRVDISFALSQAYDQRQQYSKAADVLVAGNALRARMRPWNRSRTKAEVDIVTSALTPEEVRRRIDWGAPARDPIFILGMPRSGSTLIEQVLSSHSAIEGTEELFILLQLAGELAHGKGGRQPEEVLLGLDKQKVAEIGARYIDLSRRQRVTDKPFFTDKNPSNWRYLGLIALTLPNAKIIDIRRNPMDCCFANYFQHFLAGADFSYDQRDLGHYYADYVRMMRHFESVLPGRVHRVIYDDLVENFEPEVRRLLDYLELPFEESCLRFFETKRAIHTPSSEQVRQPINKAGMGRWRNYEPWLGELKGSLAEVMEDWR